MGNQAFFFKQFVGFDSNKPHTQPGPTSTWVSTQPRALGVKVRLPLSLLLLLIRPWRCFPAQEMDERHPGPRQNSFAFHRDGFSSGTKAGIPMGELPFQGLLP